MIRGKITGFSLEFRFGIRLSAGSPSQNTGGDSDTTAAIYGQLAGAYYGEQGIPAEWLEKLAMREYITELGNKLIVEPDG